MDREASKARGNVGPMHKGIMEAKHSRSGNPASRCVVLSAAVLASIGAAAARAGAADDWTQFRGPHNNCTTTERGWVVRGAAEPVWKRNVGLGYSSVSVAAGRLYTMGYDEQAKQDGVYCLDALTGEIIWEHHYPAEIWARSHRGGTLVTPGVDGKDLFTSNREGRFFRFDAATGWIHWEKNLKTEYGLEYPTWGLAASPLILGDMIVMNVGKVIAFEKDSGEEIWASQKNYGDAYCTPVEFSLKGRSALAVFNQAGLVILDRKTGVELMVQEWTNRPNVNAAAPIILGERIFISSGYNRGCALIDVSGDSASVVWENKEMRNHMALTIHHDGHLYGFDEAVYKCLDLDGNVKWQQRGLGKGAHIMADGKLVLLTDKGELVFVEPSPVEYREIARTKVLDGGMYWTCPVLANGYFYCRNSLGDIVCLDHRSGQ